MAAVTLIAAKNRFLTCDLLDLLLQQLGGDVTTCPGGRYRVDVAGSVAASYTTCPPTIVITVLMSLI